jgi:hypothetical protein
MSDVNVPAEPLAAERWPTHHRVLVWAIAAAFLALAVIGLVAYKQGKDNELAQSRATELIALFAANDLPVPVDRSTIVDVLGPNGGPVCADPTARLTEALQDQQLANGAATVGSRPTRADRRLVAGEELVISVYCPAKLADYRQFVNANRYGRIVRD